ncbi:flagellar biosynthesis protein FlgF [Candidatus Endobugula sertula]|uniref:Flagellar basal-body rod protein FlgF n=1 Tax=Candidatus Endobugula sertula TaxID=62101 RepID=A0A1D2QQJ2_9GAMM|nr:flagellar biosynthesis protein FlgF [Candidatus Endobugula sertula]
MTAAKHTMLGQAIRANNLANVNTTGFRSDFEQARSMSVYYGDGQPTRAYALTENPATNFTTGSLIQTGRDLDVAIEGNGFIAVQSADGREAYTRVGNLSIDSAGVLRAGNGLPVIGNSGPMTIPEFQKLEIGQDGIVSVVIKGESPDALSQVDRIKLVNPDASNLKKGKDGLLYAEENITPDVNVSIVSGFLESSNVNPIEELTRIITLARQYEMSVKMMKTAEENSESSARLLQVNG